MGEDAGPSTGDAVDGRQRTPYRLCTFGRLALVDPDGSNEPSLTTRPRKLALLAWLALRPGRSATRDRVVGTFWGGRDDERARNSLSDALSHLRRVLGRDAIKARGDEVVLAADASLVVDAIALSDAAGRRDHARVVALYHGPFLDGVHIDDAHEFDDWCERTRARLAALFVRSAAARCRALALSGEWDECRVLAERWLDAEPASGDAACQLLDAIEAPHTHAARVEALAAYRALAMRLERDLGVSPSPEVARRADVIRSALEAATAAPPVSIAPVALAPSAGTQSQEQRVAAGPSTSSEETSTLSAPLASSRRGDRVSVPPNAGKALTWAGALVTLLALAGFALNRIQSRGAPALDRARVVVEVFENRTGDSTLDDVGRVAAQWISRGLAETHLVEVVDVPPAPPVGVQSDAQQLGRDVDAGSVVTGSYVMRGDSMMIEARIIDVANGSVARAVEPVVADRTDPLVGVELLRQRVAGALASELDRVITALTREGSQPPTYEAYLAWVRGLDLFSQVDFAGAVPFFLQAAALDSNFVAPLLWAAAAHGNLGQMLLCDSLIQVVNRRSARLGPLDRGLLDLWIANLKGDHAGRYKAAQRMLQEAPGSEQSLFLVGWTATNALRTNEAIAALRRIPVERSRVRWDLYGIGLSRAYHVAQRYDEELVEARRRRRSAQGWLLAIEDEGQALATLGRSAELNRLTADIVGIAPQPARTAGHTLLVVASEAFVHDHAEDGLATLGRFDTWVEAQPPERRYAFANRRLVASARYFQGNWLAADSMFTALVAERPQDPELLGWLGATAAQRGDTARALRLAATLAALDSPYLLGTNTLARARIATVLGRRAEAIALMRQSMAEGQVYESIHLLPEFKSLRGEPEFDELWRVKG